MPSLLLVVFILQLVIYAINTIGSSTLNELLWMLYIRLPSSISQSARETNRLQAQVLRLKREMGAVSAQDDFARWAKLRRQHDKAVADYEKSSSSIQSHKSTFTTTMSTARFLLLQVTRFVIQAYYTRSPMYWIPNGWLPYYVEWILCFPRAPVGSVSIQVWGFACGCVLSLAGDAVGAIWKLATGAHETGPKTTKVKMEPMAVPATPSPSSSKSSAKKEL